MHNYTNDSNNNDKKNYYWIVSWYYFWNDNKYFHSYNRQIEVSGKHITFNKCFILTHNM